MDIESFISLFGENPESLSTLRITNSSKLSFILESLSSLKALKTLDISCAIITMLPESLGQLTSLTTLDLSRCDALTGLPESLGQLAALTTMNVSYCRTLTGLPASVGQLTSLKTLDIDCCISLTELPVSLGFLEDLSVISIKGCNSIAETFRLQKVNHRSAKDILGYLLSTNQRFKILLLVLDGIRNRRRRRLPAELWCLIQDEFL